MTAPRLQTDMIIGNDFVISQLPSFGFTIVTYGNRKSIVFKRVFQTKLIESDRIVNVSCYGFFGFKKHQFVLSGNFVKVQLHERTALPKSIGFLGVAQNFRSKKVICRVAQNQAKLIHQKFKIPSNQVRLIDPQWMIELPNKTPNLSKR